MRLHRDLCLMALCAAMLLAPAGAGAWGFLGHRVVAAVAQERLTPEARAMVQSLLGEHTLDEVSTWADQVRGDRKETAPLHYINYEWHLLRPREEDLAQPQGNVHQAVLGYAHRLADQSLPAAEREEALKFLVHFVGDIHQPLHAGLAEDLGGNRTNVKWRGRDSNLHRVWDGAVLSRLDGMEPRDAAARLLSRVSERDAAAWNSVADVADWLAEGRAMMRDGAYPMVEGESLGDAYLERHAPAAEMQVTKAGVRLAAILNEIALTGESPFPPPAIEFPIPARDNFGPPELFPAEP